MKISRCLGAVLALALAAVSALSAADGESAEQLYAAAETLQAEGEHLRAIELYQRALAQWQASGDLQWQAECWYGMAVSRRRLGQPDHAVEQYGRALELLRRLGDRASEAAVLGSLGTAYEELEQLRSARESYEQALEIWRQLGRAYEQASPLRSLGNVLLTLGEVGAACAAFDDALERERDAGKPASRGLSWNGVGRCRLARGEIEPAREAFETALELARQSGRRDLEMGALNNLAEFHRRLGDLSAALERLFEANELRRQLGDKSAIADGLQNLGSLYVVLGQLRPALERYQEALELYRGAGKPKAAALARLSVSWVRLAFGEVAAAAGALERLRAEPFLAGEPRLASDVLRTLGFARLAAGRTPEAKALFERALARGRELDDLAGIMRSLTGLGQAHAALDEHAPAQACFEAALTLGRKHENPAISAASLRGLARLARAGGRLEEALTLAEQALEQVERVRRLVPTPELRATFLAGQRETFELQLDLLVRLHRRFPERDYDVTAFEASERARARGLLDLLSERGEDVGKPREPVFAERERALGAELAAAAAALETASAEQRPVLERRLSKIEEARQLLEVEIRRDSSLYDALRLGEPASLAEVRAQLEPGTALIEYALGEESSLGFVLTHEAVHSFDVAATAEQIAERVASLRRVLAVPGRRGVGAFRAQAWSLYELLIAPAEPYLGGVERLLVVPDRGLYALPFEALLTRPPTATSAALAELPYLLARWPVSYAPSASVLHLLRRPAPAAPVVDLVVFADPSTPDRPPLPASAVEGATITALLPPGRARLLRAAEASEATAKHDPAVRTARRLHFASHGVLDERWPQLSALALSRGATDGEDGLLYVYEILRLDLAAELVVLSGCETALGEEVRGEGVIGLARAFLLAGAAQVAVSLWSVDDEATAELMPRFYRHLDAAPSSAAALREAKLELVRGGSFAHPAYWASFILVGRP